MAGDEGICIVQAKKNWEFIYGNKAFCDIVGCKENQLGGQSITVIMPQEVAANHDKFIKRFYNEGQPRTLGKNRLFFVKTMDSGYLVPVSLRLNFYSNQKFNYAFIASVEKQRYMNLWQEDNVRIAGEDVMIMVTDEALNVTEIS